VTQPEGSLGRREAPDRSGLQVTRVVVGPLQTNCWVVADLRNGEALVVDPGAEARRILDAVAGLDVKTIVVTHAHGDHVGALVEVADTLGAPVVAHPAEAPVWPRPLQPWASGTRDVVGGDRLAFGSFEAEILDLPGHTPGGIGLRLPGCVISGDTLFPGGPGATGRPFSDFDAIIDSIGRVLFSLGDETVVHPGHGDDTTIGEERPHLDEWKARRW